MSNRKLARNIGIMSFAVFISRILGLIRDQVMAFYFGTSYLNDAFNVAYNLPNLIRRLFGEGALSAAFVPIYNEIGIKSDRKTQFDFAINVLSILTLFLAILTFIGIALAPILVKLLYPGLNIQTSLMAVKLSRIVFPYLFLIGMSSTLIAILNSHDYFFMTGLSSAMLNLGMIAAVAIPASVLSSKSEELIVWAGWGVILGGFFQTLVNLPYLKKIGYNFKIIISFTGVAIHSLWSRFVPAMLGVGIREINLLADALMASFLPVGSITALGFGNRLMQLPLGIFGIATGTAVLPHYSKHISEKNWTELSESLRFTTITLACMMLPVTFIILGLGDDFVRILFKRGAFGDHASVMTGQALLFYSLGLIFFSLNQTITPLFYANKDTRTPVKIAAWMVGLNIVLNFILMQFIQHRGLALATSITGMVNYFLLLLLIRKTMPEVTFTGIALDIIKILIINILVFIPFFYASRTFIFSAPLQTIGKSFALTALYFILFYILAVIFKIRYVNTVYTTIWRKLIKI